MATAAGWDVAEAVQGIERASGGMQMPSGSSDSIDPRKKENARRGWDLSLYKHWLAVARLPNCKLHLAMQISGQPEVYRVRFLNPQF